MKRYPAWQAIYRSFFSTDFYRDVAANWQGLGFLYLFILATVNAIVFAITIQFACSTFCDKFLMPLADQWPTLTSADEKFTIDKPTPYYIKDPNSGIVWFTFDTTGKTEVLDHAGFLVTDDSVIVFQPTPTSSDVPAASPAAPQTIFTASKVKGSFNRDQIKNLINTVRNYVGIATFVVYTVCGSIYLFLQALLYGLLGLIFNAIMKTRLEYLQLVRIGAVAITPALILDTLVKAGVGFFPSLIVVSQLFFVVCFIISMVYIFLGVQACKTLPTPAAGPLEEPIV